MDQGSCVEVMYPDLYKALNLKPEDLTSYNSPLVSFDGKLDAPKGLIRLPVQAGSEVHGHCRQTLASYLGCHFFNSTSEG